MEGILVTNVLSEAEKKIFLPKNEAQTLLLSYLATCILPIVIQVVEVSLDFSLRSR